MTRKDDPREWVRQRDAREKASRWEEGDRDIPYQLEAEAVEQAFRIVDLCVKSLQRAARELANIRLVRAKTSRTRSRSFGCCMASGRRGVG